MAEDPYDVIVVGCGIIGATVARAMAAQGRSVLVLDDRRPDRGTAPSGGHLRPAWFRGMPKEQYEPALELLDQTWGLKDEEYRFAVGNGPQRTERMFRVDTDLVTAAPFTAATVTGLLDRGGNLPGVRFTRDGTEHEARGRLLVLAAGVWANDLLPVGKVQAKRGVSYRVPGTCVPFIWQWAPYKQVVAHQQADDEVWVGDGTAILDKNWTGDREMVSRGRCFKALGNPKAVRRAVRQTGLRPYCPPENPTDPCLLRKVGPSCWVATGAGKSGTISAGWAARRILDATS